jgi:hypothetical protein
MEIDLSTSGYFRIVSEKNIFTSDSRKEPQVKILFH